MSSAIDAGKLTGLVGGSEIAGYRDGEVTIRAPDAQQANQLAGEYRALVTRKLGEAMRRPMRLSIVTGGQDRQSSSHATTTRPAGEWSDRMPVVPFIVAENGLSSTQLWQAALEDLDRAVHVGRSNIEAWQRPAAIIGRGETGSIVIEAPNALVARRVPSRYARFAAAALRWLLGADCTIEIVVSQEWLRAQAGQGIDSYALPAERREAV